MPNISSPPMPCAITRPYATYVFDCDGVILNSNKAKTLAFHSVALPYGREVADKLVNYHITHGGISRNLKFQHFIDKILPGNVHKPKLEALLAAYAATVRDSLLTCEIAAGLCELRQLTAGCRWLVASGGNQQELREVFAKRNITDFFDGGIFGSPDAKEAILSREIDCGNLVFPALFLGDSRYDYESANLTGLDFIFISHWTEFECWRDFIAENKICAAVNLQSLLSEQRRLLSPRIT